MNKKILCGESKESFEGIAHSVKVTSKEDERQKADRHKNRQQTAPCERLANEITCGNIYCTDHL